MTRPDLAATTASTASTTATASAPARLWLLNFDAEDELDRGSGHTSSASTRARMESLAPLVRELTGEDAVLPMVRPAGGDVHVAEGTVGFAWCPTPSAVRRLREAGATVADAPPLDVLRRANHRRFSAELGATLPASGFFSDEEPLRAHLAAGSPTHQWVLKRPFAFAGRGRLKVRDDAAELAAAASWIRASLARGGVDVTPWVERLADHALHGFVGRDGRVTLSAPTRQVCDDEGRWLRSTREHDLAPAEDEALRREGARTGEALAHIGYFGPFGVDAFRWSGLDRGHGARFCPRIEVNARYTMGWPLSWPK